MEELELRCLDEKDEAALVDFNTAMFASEGRVTPTAAVITEADGNFLNWLKRTRNNAEGRDLQEGRVPSTTMFLFRKNESKILGAVDIRMGNNSKILNIYGHIGYGVAPSERKKGYATEMLKRALEYCKKINLNDIVITCDKTNIGSAKTIIKNGGIFQNEFINDESILKEKYLVQL